VNFNDYNDWATVMIALGWPVLTIFILLYGLRSPWRSTAAGRALMQLAVALWLLYALGAANAAWGNDWPYRGVLRAIVFTTTTASFVRLLVLLVRIQRRPAIEESLPPEDGRGVLKEYPHPPDPDEAVLGVAPLNKQD
jgi:hypothetical protein